jgi:hypothetical protein
MVTGDLGKAGCSPKARSASEDRQRQRARALQLTAFGLAPSRARRRYRRRRRRLSRCSRVYSIRACSFSSPAPSASSLVSSVSVDRTQARECVGDVAVQGNLLRLASREVSTSGTRAVSALVIFVSYAYADAPALRVAGIYLLTRALMLSPNTSHAPDLHHRAGPIAFDLRHSSRERCLRRFSAVKGGSVVTWRSRPTAPRSRPAASCSRRRGGHCRRRCDLMGASCTRIVYAVCGGAVAVRVVSCMPPATLRSQRYVCGRFGD